MKPGPTDFIAASILQAADFVRQGEWRRAEALLTQVLAADPGEPDGLQLLGLVRENQGRFADAEALHRSMHSCVVPYTFRWTVLCAAVPSVLRTDGTRRVAGRRRI